MAAFSVKQFSVKLTFLLHFSEFQPGKIQNDIYTTAIAFPEEINMQEELEMKQGQQEKFMRHISREKADYKEKPKKNYWRHT